MIHKEVNIDFQGRLKISISDITPIAFKVDRLTFETFLLYKVTEQGSKN